LLIYDFHGSYGILGRQLFQNPKVPAGGKGLHLEELILGCPKEDDGAMTSPVARVAGTLSRKRFGSGVDFLISVAS